MGRLPYSTFEIRVRAVQAVLNGTPITQVAEAYQADRSTIHRWLTRYREEGGAHGSRINGENG